MTSTPEQMRERARVVAEAIQGTCHALHDHASDEEVNNIDFCLELDSHVLCCDTCGWWTEACLVNEDGTCEDCQEDNED